MTSPFSLALVAIVGLSLIGLPVAYAVIVRYGWAVWAALRGEAPEETDVTEKGYGL